MTAITRRGRAMIGVVVDVLDGVSPTRAGSLQTFFWSCFLKCLWSPTSRCILRGIHVLRTTEYPQIWGGEKCHSLLKQGERRDIWHVCTIPREVHGNPSPKRCESHLNSMCNLERLGSSTPVLTNAEIGHSNENACSYSCSLRNCLYN